MAARRREGRHWMQEAFGKKTRASWEVEEGWHEH